MPKHQGKNTGLMVPPNNTLLKHMCSGATRPVEHIPPPLINCIEHPSIHQKMIRNQFSTAEACEGTLSDVSNTPRLMKIHASIQTITSEG